MNFSISKAPYLAFKNKHSLNLNKVVGCYHCLSIFESVEIKNYTDQGETALCPKCSTDAVVPTDSLEDLEKINEFFFKKTR